MEAAYSLVAIRDQDEMEVAKSMLQFSKKPVNWRDQTYLRVDTLSSESEHSRMGWKRDSAVDGAQILMDLREQSGYRPHPCLRRSFSGVGSEYIEDNDEQDETQDHALLQVAAIQGRLHKTNFISMWKAAERYPNDAQYQTIFRHYCNMVLPELKADEQLQREAMALREGRYGPKGHRR